MNVSDVKIGQVWEDNDSRTVCRYILITGFDPELSIGLCSGAGVKARVLRANRREALDRDPEHSGLVKTRIALTRLVKGGCRGYTLLRDVTMEAPGSQKALDQCCCGSEPHTAGCHDRAICKCGRPFQEHMLAGNIKDHEYVFDHMLPEPKVEAHG